MKNYLLTLVVFACFGITSTFAQFEAKINPLGILWGGDLDLSLEYVVSDDIGIEARIPFSYDGTALSFTEENLSRIRTGVIVAGKYYFGPKLGGDNFYGGVYGKYIHAAFKSEIAGSVNNASRNRLAMGVLFGYKWVSDQGILIDINIGGGRVISETYSYDSDLDEDDQLGLQDAIEGINNIIKVDLVSSLSVGYRFGNGSRKE